MEQEDETGTSHADMSAGTDWFESKRQDFFTSSVPDYLEMVIAALSGQQISAGELGEMWALRYIAKQTSGSADVVPKFNIREGGYPHFDAYVHLLRARLANAGPTQLEAFDLGVKQVLDGNRILFVPYLGH